MPGVAWNVALATGVYFVVTLIFQGLAGTSPAMMPVIFSALVFAMAYAAILVGIVLFKGNGE